MVPGSREDWGLGEVGQHSVGLRRVLLWLHEYFEGHSAYK